ncbi:coiled-coil domain-containing protein 125 isoform X2 [Nelusetta ayraudi]|uniref:coiled-coil domain-containing protein 125 isoform X2 n=1 Tax=Nelusetta ayraudi TaxID=303726 RepID=UPI003F722E9A
MQGSTKFTHVQMQASCGDKCLDDDMVDGDLGNGLEVRKASISIRNKSQSFAGVTETELCHLKRLGSSIQNLEVAWVHRMKKTENEMRTDWKPSCFEFPMELSKDELKMKLREAAEVIDTLYHELEVTHRYLQGKYEALEILQGKAILDKATTHTKSLLQKSEERVKALEKEVNSLQWEVSFNQAQMKRSQQSWEQKYSRILNDNKTLTYNLGERETEIQQLQTQNSALKQHCLKRLSVLNGKEQKRCQGTKSESHPESNISVLEKLGSCQCFHATDSCPCSQTAASEKKLLQLQQELDAQCSRNKEAIMVADAFRIAFEQQLRKQNENFLFLTEANILTSHQERAEASINAITVNQRLKGFLPSNLDFKMPGLLETLHRLLDLLNDKEVALAHQKRVSLMLALSAEELQKKLHLNSHSIVPSLATSDTSETDNVSR